MAEISAAQVMTLRKKTDLPMMDCKKALLETGGDDVEHPYPVVVCLLLVSAAIVYLEKPQPTQDDKYKENDDQRSHIGSLLQLIQLFDVNFL